MEGFARLMLFLITLYPNGISQANDDVFHHYPLGDPRNCLQSEAVRSTQDDIPLNIMQVLPGIGWDNLRNVDAGYVNELNYSKCHTTGDRHYLLPDNVYAIPIQHSKIQTNAKLIDHWDDWSSYTSSTINGEVSLFSLIGGKFSTSFQEMKTRFINEKSKISRVELRHHFYSLKLSPNSPLDPGFKDRLLEIAQNLQNNRSRTADYLAELLIKEYGTDYTNSIEAGAALVQEDYIDAAYMKLSSKKSQKITASAAVSLFGSSLSGTYGDAFGMSDVNEYRTNRRYSNRESFGGIPLRIGTTIQQWEESLANSMVAIDRSGFPLDYAITVVSLPELPSSTRRKLRKVVRSAIARYYEVNTYKGCTDPSSPNFDYMANVGIPEACQPPETNTTFGGVFQTCTRKGPEDLCNNVEQANPLTGSHSCPTYYKPVKITRGNLRSSKTERRCEDYCTTVRHWIFFSRSECTPRCENVAVPTTAVYEGYWCVASGKIPPNTGYLFGGLFTTNKVNPITGAHTCPQHFISQKLGTDIIVCTSNDYELGSVNSLPFAGFHSCISGNPLAVDSDRYGYHPSGHSSPNSCPCGYSQHLADIDNNCQINYCVQTGQLKIKRLPEVILPPFKKKPVENQWSTDTIAVQTVGGEFWVPINNTKKWKKSLSVADYFVKDDETVVHSGNTASYSNPHMLCVGVIAVTLIVT